MGRILRGVHVMSDVMMKALQLQVESLTRQVEKLGPENERVRNLLTEFDQRHDADQARISALEAAIKRQSGAAATLRAITLAEVQDLKDMDRSEYNAAKTLDSERDANAILTAQVEALEAALAKADALAEQCDDAFYHLDGVGLPEFYHTLTAYRQARDATR